MDSGRFKLPHWQITLLISTPIVMGLGYLYWKKSQAAIQPNENSNDEKKNNFKSESISFDGEDCPIRNDQGNHEKKLTPLEMAIKFKEQGNEYFKNGKYDSAIQYYDQAIDICPQSMGLDRSMFYQNRAAAYEQLKNFAAVRDDCDAALENNPKYVKALVRRARAFENLKQLELCLEDVTFVCILEGFQNNASLVFADRVLKDLGLMHAREAMKTKKAIEPSLHFTTNYFKSFNFDPIHKVLVSSSKPKGFVLAVKSFKDGNIGDIIPACTAEIEADHSEYIMEAILLRGTFHLLAGQYANALVDFDRVISSNADPKLKSNALVKRASLQMQTEQREKSFDDFAKAIEIDPENPDTYHHRGQVNLLLENLSEAIADFTKAHELMPKHPLPYVHKLYSAYRNACASENNAELYRILEEFSDAIKHQYPDCVEAYSLFAQILSDQNQFALADDYFQKAILLDPQNAALFVHRGLLVLQWKGDLPTALSYMERAIEVDNKCEFAYETLGTVEVQRGNMERAISLFDKALEMAKSEMELTHIFSLKDAAQSQVNVTKKMGISLQDMMSTMSGF